MCGILGFINQSVNTELILTMLENQLHRGQDSYGIILYDGKNYILYKSIFITDFIKYLQEKEEKGEIFKWFIIHHRKASVGSINIENSHPIWDKKISVAVIQNGTKRSLAIKERNDTYGIMVLYKANELEKEDLKNSGVVFIIDMQKDKILFHKDKSRTLYYNPELKIFASETVLSGTWYKVKEFQLKEFNAKKFDSLPIEKDKKIIIDEVETGLCNICYSEGILVNDVKYGNICIKCNELSDKEKERKINERWKRFYSKNSNNVKTYERESIYYYEF